MTKLDPPRILPFGDKFGMLVIVFLILSLGFGVVATRNDDVSSIPPLPSLITVRQISKGPLGMEKLIYLNIMDTFFVDKPTVYPTGLDIYATSHSKDWRANLSNFVDEHDVLQSMTGPSGAFPSQQHITPRNTGFLTRMKLFDKEAESQQCIELLSSEDAALAVGGQCKTVSESGFENKWKQIVARTSRTDFGCMHRNCLYETRGLSVSFSGVDAQPWNGAAVTYRNRESGEKPLILTGIMCYLDPNAQNWVAEELREKRSRKTNLIARGFNALWLFEGERGADYLRVRLEDNAHTQLIVSSFTPTSGERIREYKLSFSGLLPDSPVPDGILFQNYEQCENISESLKTASVAADVRNISSYTGHILHLFEIIISNGEIVDFMGTSVTTMPK